MSRLLRAYLRVLEKHPWKTQAVSTGILMGTGDAIAQLAVERRRLVDYDPVRTSRYFIFGTIGVGPVLRTWYMALERMLGPSSTTPKLLFKVATDQILFAPPFVAFIVASLKFWECKSVDVVKEKFEKEYVNIMITNWKLWPAAQIINFYYIPFQHRVMYVQVVALFWNTYLAWKIGAEKSNDTNAKDSSDSEVAQMNSVLPDRVDQQESTLSDTLEKGEESESCNTIANTDESTSVDKVIHDEAQSTLPVTVVSKEVVL